MDEQIKNDSQTEAPKSVQSSRDDQSKIWGILGYILFGVTFFIPLVTDSLKNNLYSKFHANQQLILLICWVAKMIIFSMLAVSSIFLGFWGSLGILSLLGLISWAINIALLVFAIMGIISAAKGEMKPLPIIGGIKIIK